MPEETTTETVETPAQEIPPTDWQAEARKWERRAKDNMAKLDEAKPKLAEYDAILEASKSDLQRTNEEKARWQTEAERWRNTSVSSRIEVLASQEFADPSDAAAALPDASKYLDAGGVINEAAIKADLAAVLEKKPHWRRSEGAPTARTPLPNTAQGTSARSAAPATPAEEFGALLRQKMT